MKIKPVLSVFLLLSLALSLCACGAPAPSAGAPGEAASPAVPIAEPRPASETVPGYVSTEIETPDWLASLGSCEMLGDVMYFSAQLTSGGRAAASYDTLSGEWRRYDLSLEGPPSPRVSGFSAAGNSLWFLFEEAGDRGISGYSLLRLDLGDGAQTCRPLDFWHEGDPYLCSFIALDDSRILVGDGDSTFLLNAETEQLGDPGISVLGEGLHVRVDGVLYLNTAEGFCPLDSDTLRFGAPVSGVTPPFIYGGNRGHLLVTENSDLYQISVNSSERVKLFDWLDVALGYSNWYGFLCGRYGFENSAGDIYHLSNKLTKVSFGEVPLKKTLKLACLGPSEGLFPAFRDNPSTGTEALMDAVLRFNNSDPEYRVEFVPLLYSDNTERDRLLISLASGSEYDLLDTSFLPAGAADAGLLVDLLPYIDADPSLSRDDFLPGLLSAMSKSGGLYEYLDKVNLLSIVTHPDCVTDGTWTVESVERLIEQHPDARLPSGQEELINQFSLAATAEFLDYADGVSLFDSPAFISWLSLLQTLCSKPSEPGPGPWLFTIHSDLPSSSGSRMHRLMQGDYVFAGFPDAAGTGSYFTFSRESIYPRTALGIMVSGQNRDGAWRFLRTFMRGETEPNLFTGIPVSRASFEQALDIGIRRQQRDDPEWGFSPEDADRLRDVVYHTDKLVNSDPAVLSTLSAALTAFLSGKADAPETARQIHSRMSLYMAEQYG